MLTLSQLLIGHKGRPITAPLTATAEAGRLVALIGRNGVGKSTLLRTLCGLQKPLGGKVLWDGKSLSGMGRKELARRVSVVLTARSDTGMLTVRNVVAMGRMPYTPLTGRLSQQDELAVDEAVRLCGLEALQQRVFNTLSDGERQRTMIAKALAQQTPAVLLDEPTAFLDYVAKDEVFALLQSLAHDGHKLVLLATHDLTAARRFADVVLQLSAEGLQTTHL